MADGVSIREFARQEGLSDTLVRRALKQGRLKACADESIDPALVGTAWCARNAKALVDANTSANTPPCVRTGQVRERPAPPPRKEAAKHARTGLEAEAEQLIKSGNYDLVTYAQALEKKENYLALLRQLEYEEKSGALVELAVAERALFEGARSQRDAWLNWPARVGALIAADLGLEADRVTEALTEHVHKHISQLGQADVQFNDS